MTTILLVKDKRSVWVGTDRRVSCSDTYSYDTKKSIRKNDAIFHIAGNGAIYSYINLYFNKKCESTEDFLRLLEKCIKKIDKKLVFSMFILYRNSVYIYSDSKFFDELRYDGVYGLGSGGDLAESYLIGYINGLEKERGKRITKLDSIIMKDTMKKTFDYVGKKDSWTNGFDFYEYNLKNDNMLIR